MKKRKAKNKVRSKYGITLIALIITVVIMLILAGVAISAVVSGDGLFDRTRYVAELQNFTQMQEAIQLYYYTVTDGTLPVSRNVSVEELESNQNLKNEIGYYRVFLQTGERPILPQDFSGDFMETPSGIADLYYLDNEKLNANTNKQYIYDTVTGEIYLIEGVKVKGETAYSESGMREIMNENYVPDYIENVTMPPSPEPGTGAGYDFKFASGMKESTNLYKIYNNGDVYAIGEKGIRLNTSAEEMEEFNINKWEAIDFSNIINGFEKVFVGNQIVRKSQAFITNSGDVYVFGNNGRLVSNKFGVTEEILSTYNENGLNKLDFPYGKIKNMFIGDNLTFVITEDNKLYATGINHNGQLGIGNYENQSTYQEVKGIANVSEIKNIHTFDNDHYIIIEMNDNTFYFSGLNYLNALGDGRSGSYKTNVFEQIWHEGEFDIDQDIEKLCATNGGNIILKKDGTIMLASSHNYMQLTDLIGTDKTKFREFKLEVGSNITDITSLQYGLIVEQTINGNTKYYGYEYHYPNYVGIGLKNFAEDEKKLYEIILPEELISEGVKEFQSMNYSKGLMFISNAGNVFYCGDSVYSGLDNQPNVIEEVIKLPISNIEEFYKTDMDYQLAYVYLQGKDGKVYTIQNSLSQINKNKYQFTFKNIANNIKDVSTGSNNKIAYISKDGNLYVAGDNKSELGLGVTDISPQRQYIKVEDSNIAGKVKETSINNQHIYILTTDNKLYVTGKSGINGTYAPGWSEVEDKYSFVEILSDVEGFFTSLFAYKIAYNQNNIWIWYSNTNVGHQYNTPYKIDLSSINPSLVNNISSVRANNYNGFYIITKDGQVWSRGSSTAVTGTGEGHSNFIQIPQGSFDNKKIVKMVVSENAAPVNIVLTEDGKLYGWGVDKSLLGLGEMTTAIQTTPTLLPIDNVKDIISLREGFIAVKENGEVWATGNNASGIFGRWISSDARYAETINQTAYEWVRCPALEK